jgi:hypothetical protein
MSDHEDFLRKHFKSLTAAYDAIKAQQSIAQGVMSAQQSAVQDALKAHQPAQDAIDAFMSPAIRIQAEIDKALGPVTPAMLATFEKEMKEHERLQALFTSGGIQDQIKAAVDALKMGDLLRSSPEIEPAPDTRYGEYLENMHRAADDSKAAMREYIAAEIKRQLDGRDDEPETAS